MVGRHRAKWGVSRLISSGTWRSFGAFFLIRPGDLEKHPAPPLQKDRGRLARHEIWSRLFGSSKEFVWNLAKSRREFIFLLVISTSIFRSFLIFYKIIKEVPCHIFWRDVTQILRYWERRNAWLWEFWFEGPRLVFNSKVAHWNLKFCRQRYWMEGGGGALIFFSTKFMLELHKY